MRPGGSAGRPPPGRWNDRAEVHRATRTRRRRAGGTAALLVLLAGLVGGAAGGTVGAATGALAALAAALAACLPLFWEQTGDLRTTKPKERNVPPGQFTEPPRTQPPPPWRTGNGHTSRPPRGAGPAPGTAGEHSPRPASAHWAGSLPPPSGTPAPQPALPAAGSHRELETPGAVGGRREAGRFPRPLGTAGAAHGRPWLLAPEPGPSGIAADAALAGGLRVRAASVVGPGHRCDEPAVPRQDAYRIAVDGGRRRLIVAIADGMSDSSHSHIGANVAAAALVRHLWAEAAGGPRDARARQWFVSAAGHRLKAFLPHSPNPVGASFRLEPGAVLALTTDGIGDALHRADLGAWFADRWAEPPHITDFVNDVGFEAKGELDDRTAVVVWVPERGGPP